MPIPQKYPLSEWSSTFMMLGIALCILLTPRTIEMGSFRFMTEAGLSPLKIFMIFATAGLMRIFALYANGRWSYGTHARALAAVIGAFMWFQMAWALILLTSETGTLSVGIPVYLVLTATEVVSCYRVARDSNIRWPGTAHARGFGGSSQ